jgi:hypothetical protein
MSSGPSGPIPIIEAVDKQAVEESGASGPLPIMEAVDKQAVEALGATGPSGPMLSIEAVEEQGDAREGLVGAKQAGVASKGKRKNVVSKGGKVVSKGGKAVSKGGISEDEGGGEGQGIIGGMPVGTRARGREVRAARGSRD